MALATLFCLAGGLVPWSDVMPELYAAGEIQSDFYFLASFIVVMCWTLLQVVPLRWASSAGSLSVRARSVR